MKKVVYSILGGALLLALPMFLTSCDDILGEWSKPAPAVVTPEPEAPVKLTSITLNKPSTTLNVGTTETLKVDAFAPDDATDKSVTWSSDKDAVATVDENGLVTAVAVGTAVITATAKDGSGVTDKCTVTVSVPGLLSGEFSIASDKRVRFAQGNLQATTSDNGSSWTWGFAANQWDYVGDATANNAINGDGTVSTNGTVDLFGRVGGSSTTLTTGAAQYGITKLGTGSDYGIDPNTDNLKTDWGNTIGTGWRTLTKDEWVYLLKTRESGNTISGTDDARFAKAKLFDTTHGLIIFPDNYTLPDGVADPMGINKTDATSWAANMYDAADWAKMEAAGCVFLPAAGSRSGASVTETEGAGRYWSSTYSSWNYSCVLNFHYNEVNPEGGQIGRGTGCSVRLVQDVK